MPTSWRSRPTAAFTVDAERAAAQEPRERLRRTRAERRGAPHVVAGRPAGIAPGEAATGRLLRRR